MDEKVPENRLLTTKDLTWIEGCIHTLDKNIDMLLDNQKVMVEMIKALADKVLGEDGK
jgi:hypothetical protein